MSPACSRRCKGRSEIRSKSRQTMEKGSRYVIQRHVYAKLADTTTSDCVHFRLNKVVFQLSASGYGTITNIIAQGEGQQPYGSPPILEGVEKSPRAEGRGIYPTELFNNPLKAEQLASAGNTSVRRYVVLGATPVHT